MADSPWMQSEGVGSPAWLISSMPSEASTLLMDLGQGGSGPSLPHPSSYSIAGPKVARRQRKAPYLDAMTIKADHHKTVVDPTATEHGRLLIEPTIVPDLDHTGVNIGLKAAHRAAGQGPGDLPSMVSRLHCHFWFTPPPNPVHTPPLPCSLPRNVAPLTRHVAL